MKWITCGHTLPQRWAFKNHVPEPWQRWAIRVRFTFETAWIVRDDQGAVFMPDGNWAPAFDFYLRTPGHVIGLRDRTTADGHDWSQEWRAAMDDRIRERMKLGNPR
jgi:hypothetical protein